MKHRGTTGLLVLSVALAGLLGAGCLGQDYKRIELTLSDADRGWLALVEPDEEFSVVLRDSPLHPEAAWTLVGDDPAIVTLRGSFYEASPQGNPDEMPQEEREALPAEQLGVRIFEFTALALGESALDFELVEGQERIDIAGFTIGVVEDACEGDLGLAAPRCRRDSQANSPDAMNWQHGEIMALSVGESSDIRLAGNALHPEASWQIVDYDTSVVTLTNTALLPARTPGNWDTHDPYELESFLPVSQFWFTGAAAGETTARFELTSNGAVIEICDFTLSVED